MSHSHIISSENISPLALFQAMRARYGVPCAILESMTFDETNRMSLIACCPRQEIISHEASLKRLKKALEKAHTFTIDARFSGGLIGYFPFEMFGEIEQSCAFENSAPHALFYEFDRLAIFDHAAQTLTFLQGTENRDFEKENAELLLACSSFETPASSTFPANQQADFNLFDSEFSKSEFEALVKKAKRHIEEGDIFQVVLSSTFSTSIGDFDGIDVYQILREIEPTTHLFFLDFGSHGQVVGASPEILGSKIDDQVCYRPIAGTRFRGKNAEEDQRLLQEMSEDEKENAEHDMLVDLGRNDLGKICVPGTIRVAREKYGKYFSSVMHLVTDIVGTIAPEFDAFDFFQSIFPPGTLTGAPKIRAVELIQKYEKSPRGLYGGAVGYFSTNQNMELAIAIRTLHIKNGIASFRTGAGIVQDSVPAQEFLEVQNKAKTLAKILTFLTSK